MCVRGVCVCVTTRKNSKLRFKGGGKGCVYVCYEKRDRTERTLESGKACVCVCGAVMKGDSEGAQGNATTEHGRREGDKKERQKRTEPVQVHVTCVLRVCVGVMRRQNRTERRFQWWKEVRDVCLSLCMCVWYVCVVCVLREEVCVGCVCDM